MIAARKIPSTPSAAIKFPISRGNYLNFLIEFLGDDKVAEAIAETKYEMVGDKFDYYIQVEYAKKKGKEVMMVWGRYCIAFENAFMVYPEERKELRGGLKAMAVKRFLRCFDRLSEDTGNTIEQYVEWYIDSRLSVSFDWGIEVDKVRDFFLNYEGDE